RGSSKTQLRPFHRTLRTVWELSDAELRGMADLLPVRVSRMGEGRGRRVKLCRVLFSPEAGGMPSFSAHRDAEDLLHPPARRFKIHPAAELRRGRRPPALRCGMLMRTCLLPCSPGRPRPRVDGVTLGLVALTALLAARPARAAPVSFRNEVMAVLSRAGCNQGACHGNQNGKNGFRLSLRGQDPDFDLAALTRDMLARRADRLRPDDSLLLAK